MSDKSEDLSGDIIAELDNNRTVLDLSDRSDPIRSKVAAWQHAHPGEPLPKEVEWEQFAIDMMAVPRHRRQESLAERFRPMLELYNRDSDPPQARIYPDVAALLDDEQVVAYYLHRSATTPNPILKARYADFAWTAMKKLHDPSAYLYGLDAADAYLAQRPLCIGQQAHIELAENLDRTAEIAMELNNRGLAERVVEAIVDSLEQLAVVERARWVLDLGDSLLYLGSKFRDLVARQTWEKVQGICDEGIRHYESKEHQNPFLARDLMHLATEVAHRQEAAAAAWDYQVRIAESLYNQSKQREMEEGVAGGKLVACKFMEDAMHFYQQLASRAPSDEEKERLRREVDKTKRELRRLLKEAEKEMVAISESVDIPREVLDQIVAPLLQVEPEAALERLSFEESLLPHIADIRRQAEAAAEKHPLSSLFGRVTIRDGRKVDEIPATQDEDVRFLDRLGHWSQINAQLLDIFFFRLREEGRFSKESFMAHLRRWEFLDEVDAQFIEAALERYFADDHISAVHILTPRIEHMLKSAFEEAGLIPIVVPDQRRIREQTLGEFLQREEVRRFFGEDTWYYLQFSLVDERGLNIRNDVAHGWIRPFACNRALVQVLLFIILLLTRIRRVPEPQGNKGQTDPSEGTVDSAEGGPA